MNIISFDVSFSVKLIKAKLLAIFFKQSPIVLRNLMKKKYGEMYHFFIKKCNSKNYEMHVDQKVCDNPYVLDKLCL